MEFEDHASELERLDAFEKMLDGIRAQMEIEAREMERLKAEGKERSATFRQYMANRLMLRSMLDRYREHGLIV